MFEPVDQCMVGPNSGRKAGDETRSREVHAYAGEVVGALFAVWWFLVCGRCNDVRTQTRGEEGETMMY